MAPDPLTEKFHRAFDVLDADHDGKIDRSDSLVVAQRVAEVHGHPPDSPKARRITEDYLRIWFEILRPIITNELPHLTRDHFVDSLRTFVEHDDRDSLEAVARAAAEVFFEAADEDKNHVVSRDEFRAYVLGYFPDLSDAAVDKMFSRVDANGDGELTLEEVVQATVDFWTSIDPDRPDDR